VAAVAFAMNSEEDDLPHPNGYLTTPGAPAHAVWSLIEDLGFNIEVQYQKPVAR
jgi:hypothetical protein